MSIKVSFAEKPKSADTLVAFVFDDMRLEASLSALDKKAGGLIGRALKTAESFEGKAGQSLTVILPEVAGHERLVLAGGGKRKEITDLGAETLGGKLFPVLSAAGAENAVLLAGALSAAHVAHGVCLRGYTFEKYKTVGKGKKKTVLKSLLVVTEDHAKAAKEYKGLEIVASGTILARDLLNEPPNVLYPESFAARLVEELKPLGVEIEIFDEKKMEKLGMGALLAVGMGSERPPRLAIMRWNVGKKGGKAPLAFVGKGLTFDTGGISLKPGKGMEDMKLDMGGAAAVIGLMKVLAMRKSKASVVGVVGLAENMPSGRAYRPADILTSFSGKTIEVLNTDAEGRLVLADALSYVQKTYKPSHVIDLATLTGAIMVALGHEYCGTFVNDDGLWGKMEAASKACGERLWRMPLDEVWKKDVESAVADLQNIGGGSPSAGACTAAGFLEHFIEDGVKWAHMDIAGTAWIKADKPTVPKGGTGFGVRILNQLVADHFE